MLSSLSPSRRRLVLGLLAALALLLGVVVAALARPDAVAPQADRNRPGPVIVVPGYAGTAEGLEPLADRLRAAGRDVVVVEPPGDGRGDLRETAQVLDDVAQQAIEDGAGSVDVVGFSAGGVVARYWAASLGGAAVARDVVTLGSPHHGTDLARLGAALAPGSCPQGCRQLAPGSDLMRGLNAGDETPEGPGWTSVWSEQDEVVTPPDSARLDGADNVVVQDVCPGAQVTHSGLVGLPLVQAIVLEALGTPTPVDCVSS